MSGRLGRLKALTVSRANLRPGLYADGGGLYLQISGAGGRSWVYRYMLRGKAREMGLGSAYDGVTLADARASAEIARRQRSAGIDPIDARKAAQTKDAIEAARAVTFKACAEAYIEAHRPGWRNDKHAAQWGSTLKTYAYPLLGALPAHHVDVGPVLKVLQPIWTRKPETASRVRGRIEAVLDWAAARGFRSGDNPARWRGHLEKLLPERSKVRRVRHFPALPYADIGAFMRELRKQDGTAARALEFGILTAARTSEVIGARWHDLNLADRMWTVPPDRIKGGAEHRVPLSAAALAVIESMKERREGEFLFPGGRAKRPLSNMAMLQLLARLEERRRGGWKDRQGEDITVHGFRSTFRDWAAERTNFAREVAEMALAHTIADEVEAAYRRGDLFEKRRQLMTAWAGYCATVAEPAASDNVVSMAR